jgi:S-adenosylmethionine:diacylglycerol 3-amino-3-carboxypropyl transferase
MHTYNQQTLIGARIPSALKEKLSKYCLSNGIKINYFITQAIKERLQEISEDNQDIATGEERLKKPDFISQKEFNAYLSKRGIKP